jgi:1,4-dihydroxy-2-naphthoate octaprenyltransferase
MANSKPQKSSAKQAAPKGLELVKLLLAGARLRTLPLSVAPVLRGLCATLAVQPVNVLLAVPSLVVAISLQIGVNFANDYSDGIRGTDANRVGPMRLTASGAVPAKTVRNAALCSFLLAAIAGLVAVAVTAQWWLVAVGAACIAAAWFYTGGKRPYGYSGLGELAVMIFFGLVPTVGTTYLQVGHLDQTSVLFGLAAGFFAVAVLLVNNLRDRENDAKVGKRTLSVRIGATASKVLFLLSLWLPLAIATLVSVVYPSTALAWLSVLLIAPITLIFVMAKSPKDLITVLKLSSYAALVYAVLELLAFSIQ